MKPISLLRFTLSVFLAVAAFSNSRLYSQVPMARTEKGRQALKTRLATIRLDTFEVDNLPLSEVLKNLSNAAKRRDPEKRGVNFLLNPHGEIGAGANPPAIGLAAEPVDVAALPIRIPAMTDISLEDALKALVKVAGPPRLKYMVEDYAVVIYPSAEAVPLIVRVFKVDPNSFQQGLHSVVGVPFGNVNVRSGSGGGGGGGGQAGQNGPGITVPRVEVTPGVQGGIPSVARTNGIETVQASVRRFLQGLGVDMSPPKSAIFNDRQGTLIVRATAADMELIEAALGR